MMCAIKSDGIRRRQCFRRTQGGEQSRRRAGGAQRGVLLGCERLEQLAARDVVQDRLLVFAGAEKERDFLETDRFCCGGGREAEQTNEDSGRETFHAGVLRKKARGIPLNTRPRCAHDEFTTKTQRHEEGQEVFFRAVIFFSLFSLFVSSR